MGKTNPTYRDTVRNLRKNEFEQYRRALRYEHQERFDFLWDQAELHSMAGGAYRGDPMEAILLSMMIAQQRELDDLRDRLDRYEDKADSESQRLYSRDILVQRSTSPFVLLFAL